jgi:hypothetical protein
LHRLRAHRFFPTLIAPALVLAVSFAVRVALAARAWPDLDAGAGELARIFATGLVCDLAIAACFAAALSLYLAAVPSLGRRARSRGGAP